jgi:hypothetical protein
MYLLSINLASKHYIKTLNALDTNAVTRPAKKREIQERQDTGPKKAAAAAMMAEPARDGDDKVWSLYYCLTCGEKGHFSMTYKRLYN